MWLGIFALYSTIPSIYWVLIGGSYSILDFYRLYELQPLPEEIIHLLTISVGYVSGFAFIYLLLRNQVLRPKGKQSFGYIDHSKMLGAFVIVALFQLGMLVLGAGGFIRTPESYYDAYLVLHELPLAARQIIKIGEGFSSVGMLVLLTGILQRWPRQKHLLFGYMTVLLVSFDPRGARTTIAVGIISMGIAWHLLVRPIPMRRWVTAGIVGMIVFTVLGLIRALESFEEFGTLTMEGHGMGEFDASWANAVELMQAKQAGWLEIPIAARFAEIWAFLPSQLFPFEKQSLSDWFLETFHPELKAIGGGWAFGAIAQAVIGGGVTEAVIRGGVLGWIAALTMRWYRSRETAWWQLPLYLYILVFVYQSIRDTTFQPIGSIIQIVIPALLIISFLGELFNLRPSRLQTVVGCQESST